MQVWDNAGIERNVEPVDAKEILAGGGSSSDPNAEVEVETVAEEKSDEGEAVEPKAVVHRAKSKSK